MTELVQAFRQAFPHEPVGLEIVGEGPERAAIEQELQGDTRIVLHGNIPAAGLYGGWDCYVSAARYEPFGLTLLEAMQQKLPIVATQTQGAMEIFDTQNTKPSWAKPNDIESLAGALQQAYRAKQKEVAWDITPFDPTHILTQIDDIYRKVLS
jgi:glycosyltransferase involved in cell wall biosynthesis